MGSDKALVDLGGVPLVSYARDTLLEAGAVEVIAVGGDREALGRLGLRAVADRFPGEGPLGGIVTGLSAATTEAVVVLACDQPALDAPSIHSLLAPLQDSDVDVVVPVVNGRRLALSAAYRARAGRLLGEAFAAGERAPHRALDRLEVQELHDLDASAFVDLDSPDDLRRYASSDPYRRDLTEVEMDVPEIDVEQLERLVADGATIVDVREPDEWAEGHIDGALLISLVDLPERVDDIPDQGAVYLVCRSGNRSSKAAEFLMRQGYDAINVSGGMVAWTAAGKPTR
jgi:molybdopterin-guanine dinucleotide biosynthesis protein A/rhodanese-related sulfurtransferase